jgi:hypothetical protein
VRFPGAVRVEDALPDFVADDNIVVPLLEVESVEIKLEVPLTLFEGFEMELEVALLVSKDTELELIVPRLLVEDVKLELKFELVVLGVFEVEELEKVKVAN